MVPNSRRGEKYRIKSPLCYEERGRTLNKLNRKEDHNMNQIGESTAQEL